MNENASAQFRVAIVGASTLKGREVRSILSERSFPIKNPSAQNAVSAAETIFLQ